MVVCQRPLPPQSSVIPYALLRVRYVLCCLWRKLRDANCGHVPPLILRTHGPYSGWRVQRSRWVCFSTGKAPSRKKSYTLAISWSSTRTERLQAPNPHREDYGDKRLAEVIRENRSFPVSDLPAAIQASVQEFSGDIHADDITLIVARCRQV